MICLLLAASMFVGIISAYAASDVPRMNKDDLKALLANPDLIIIDVRTGKDWKSSEFKIQGATHVSSAEYESWAGNYPKDKKIVIYCA